MRVDLISISSFPPNASRCGRRGRAIRARLLVVRGREIADRQVLDLPDLLRPGDVLVFNDTKVIPAQLEGRRGEASIGATLHKREGPRDWQAFLRNAKRARVGDAIDFGEGVSASVVEKADGRLGAASFPRRRAGRAAARAGGADAAAALHRLASGRPTRRTAPIIRRCSRARKARSRRRPPRCISRRGCSRRSTRAESGARR